MASTADPELLRLLDEYERAILWHAAGNDKWLSGCQIARAALLTHLATHYIPRDAIHSYQAARGVLPWRPGDELPEDAIRRLRDGEAGRLRTLYADDTGAVIEGVADFEGDE